MEKIRFIELLRKKESGEISMIEQKQLSEILSGNDAFASIADAVKIFSTDSSNFNTTDNTLIEEELAKLNQKIKYEAQKHTQKFFIKHKRILLAAASVLLFIGLGIFYFMSNNPVQTNSQNIVSTKKGSKSNIVLPDGTKVWINADSKITYDESFGKRNREITLTGEAYFDVVKDKDKPFIVHTQILDVKVLGTVFNVKSYENEKNTETSLIRGSIEVTLKNNPGKKIMLRPNEKLVVKNDNATVPNWLPTAKKPNEPLVVLSELEKAGNDDTALETQWMKNRLAFENKKLEDIVLELSRWYGVEINISNDALKKKEYRGIFEDQSLQQVLEALRLTGGFHYTIDKNLVTITP